MAIGLVIKSNVKGVTMKPDLKGLMKLGRYLQRVPRKQFNQSIWWEKATSEKKSECGTAGCVAGWAATVFPSRFKRAGQETDVFEGVKRTYYGVEHRRSGLSGTEAFARGFRISDDDAYMICAPEADHETPKQAARAIFNLVNRLKQEGKQ
jgi:hypothetical protein